MNPITNTLLIVTAACIVVFVGVYFFIKYLKKKKNIRVGKNGEKKVAKVLNKFATKVGGKVIHDIYLPLYDKTTQIDHLLIAPFGMVCVETKTISGDIYGGQNDKNWTQILGEQKNTFYNPLRQNKTHIDCIHYLLTKHEIYCVEIESLVVFASEKSQLFVARGLPVIRLEQLKKYLQKKRYQKDHGVDMIKVYQTLLEEKVTDKKLLKKHNENVAKAAKLSQQS